MPPATSDTLSGGFFISSISGKIRVLKYKHYKGKEYEVIGIAKHSETLEEFVAYKALYDKNQLWIRPKEKFFEKVIVDGKKKPRFMRIK